MCCPNEAIRHNGKVLVSYESKADAFAAHNAKVSKLEFSREEREKNRLAKIRGNAPSVDDSSTAEFSIEELNRAIKKMRKNGAAGPDDIPPSFLKALGPLARGELLGSFNQSLHELEVPQAWRNATIIPLLKAGKPAGSIESYRPVSLTSCIMKTMERMVHTRLYHLAEARGIFKHSQAGFRKNRSCEDQLLRMIQDVSDGFQEKKPRRTVMALLDLSRAYDRVWKLVRRLP